MKAFQLDKVIYDAIWSVPVSSSDDIHFADVRIAVGENHHPIGASSLTFGRAAAIEKCRSEFFERWAHFEWELAGHPILPGIGLTSNNKYQDPLNKIRAADSLRLDATGYCAGPPHIRSNVLWHGILEVLERDVIVRILDRGDLTISLEQAPFPERLTGLLARQKATADIFVARRDYLPPVAIAIVNDTRRTMSAVGTACRFDAESAVVQAVLEGCMMLTTVRHQVRHTSESRRIRELIAASSLGTTLREELQRHAANCAIAVNQTCSPLNCFDRIIRSFGCEPVCVKFPISLITPNVEVWRVILDGAVNPTAVTREPWPVG